MRFFEFRTFHTPALLSIVVVLTVASPPSISFRATMADDSKTRAEDSLFPDELVGKWNVSYHPNRAVRKYEFRPDGTAALLEQTGWSGSLTPHFDSQSTGKARKKWKLTFDGDSEDRFELLTWTSDGRLLVEHYNPGATALPDYDQIGIGVRPAVPRLNEKVDTDVEAMEFKK